MTFTLVSPVDNFQNFTYITELRELNSHIFFPILDMREGSVKSIFFRMTLENYLEDAYKYIKSIDTELEKDFPRMNYFIGGQKIEYDNFLKYVEYVKDPIEKKLLKLTGSATSLGLGACLIKQGIESDLHVGEMENEERQFSMETFTKYNYEKALFDIKIHKILRCFALLEKSMCTYATCILEISRKASFPDDIFITLNFLRIPPADGICRILDF